MEGSKLLTIPINIILQSVELHPCGQEYLRSLHAYRAESQNMNSCRCSIPLLTSRIHNDAAATVIT